MQLVSILLILITLSSSLFSYQNVEEIEEKINNAKGGDEMLKYISEGLIFTKDHKQFYNYSRYKYMEGNIYLSQKKYNEAKLAFQESAHYYFPLAFEGLSKIYFAGISGVKPNPQDGMFELICEYEILKFLANEKKFEEEYNNLRIVKDSIMYKYLKFKQFYKSDNYYNNFIKGFISENCIVGLDDKTEDYIPCDTKTAYGYYSKSLDQSIEKKIDMLIRLNYYRLGNLLENSEKERNDMSKKYGISNYNKLSKEAISFYEKANLPFAELKLGIYYAEENNLDKAKQYFNLAHKHGFLKPVEYFYDKYIPAKK